MVSPEEVCVLVSSLSCKYFEHYQSQQVDEIHLNHFETAKPRRGNESGGIRHFKVRQVTLFDSRKLNPSVMIHGLLCAGVKLSLASSLFDSKHEIFLPKNHYVYHLIIEHYHQISRQSGEE